MFERLLRLFPYVQHLEERNEIMNEGLEIAGRVELELRNEIGTLKRIVTNDNTAIRDCSKLLKEKGDLLDEIHRDLGIERVENKKLEHQNRELETVVVAMMKSPHYINQDKKGKYIEISSKEQEICEQYKPYIEVAAPRKDLKIYIQKGGKIEKSM